MRLLKPGTGTVRFNVKSVYEGHLRTTYRGVPAGKCPFDYVIYQMIVSESRPDLILEIGTNKGGSALYLADLLNCIGNGMVHTIDINDIADPLVKKHPRISLFSSGYLDYDIAQLKRFQSIMVIDDGSHTYKDTLRALEIFSPFVNVGSYYIVEDGIIDALGLTRSYEGGPLRAIKEFLEANKSFEIDRGWCDLYGTNATFNVNGYLKKLGSDKTDRGVSDATDD